MAGYSGTPLPRKLGIKEGSRVALVNAPDGFAAGTLGDLPDGARIVPEADAPVDVAVFFTEQHADLALRFPALKGLIEYNGGLWIAWPKKVPGVPFDLVENAVREIGLECGLVDNKVCAIDERWSGLRFVYRREDRPK